MPSEAPSALVTMGHNRAGDVVGHTGVTYGDLGWVLTEGQGPQTLPALGELYWEHLYWDGEDYHFSNGRVRFTHANAINSSGLVVGDSTLDARGTYAYEYISHAVAFDPVTRSYLDLTPDYEKAAATAVNDAGTVTGWVQTPQGRRAFRQDAGQPLQILDTLDSSTQGLAVSLSGMIVGSSSIVPSGVIGTPHAFASVADTVVVDLGLPSQNGVDSAAAYGVNDFGAVVGASWKQNDSREHFATYWQHDGEQWQAYDLNELLETEDILLENAIGITNTGQVLVGGRPDGTDVLGTRLYLLTPDEVNTRLFGDIADDSELNSGDIDLLVEAVSDSVFSSAADLNNDLRVDGLDLRTWLAAAGSVNRASGRPYLPGDANLDGAVDLADLDIWRENRFTTDRLWSGADFNADGVTDGRDFSVWNTHKAVAYVVSGAVPEPSSFATGLILLILMGLNNRRWRRQR